MPASEGMAGPAHAGDCQAAALWLASGRKPGAVEVLPVIAQAALVVHVVHHNFARGAEELETVAAGGGDPVALGAELDVPVGYVAAIVAGERKPVPGEDADVFQKEVGDVPEMHKRPAEIALKPKDAVAQDAGLCERGVADAHAPFLFAARHAPARQVKVPGQADHLGPAGLQVVQPHDERPLPVHPRMTRQHLDGHLVAPFGHHTAGAVVVGVHIDGDVAHYYIGPALHGQDSRLAFLEVIVLHPAGGRFAMGIHCAHEFDVGKVIKRHVAGACRFFGTLPAEQGLELIHTGIKMHPADPLCVGMLDGGQDARRIVYSVAGNCAKIANENFFHFIYPLIAYPD